MVYYGFLRPGFIEVSNNFIIKYSSQKRRSYCYGMVFKYLLGDIMLINIPINVLHIFNLFFKHFIT
jgi:hypothetical protein